MKSEGECWAVGPASHSVLLCPRARQARRPRIAGVRLPAHPLACLLRVGFSWWTGLSLRLALRVLLLPELPFLSEGPKHGWNIIFPFTSRTV